MHRFVVPGLLLLSAGLAAADGAPVIRLAEIPIHFTAKDLSKVETAALWVTTNGGASWQQVAEAPVAVGAVKGPTFIYRPPADGSYGFTTRAEMRDGSADPKPLAGQPPQARYVVVVDRSEPLIEQFEVVDDQHDSLLLTIRWRVGDANPRAKPVQFSMAPREGGEWIPFGPKHPAAGSWTVPFPTATHRLRLEAVDRAGNHSVSEPWQAPAPMPQTVADEPAEKPALPASPAAEAPPASSETDPALDAAIADLPDPDAIDIEEQIPVEPLPTFIDSPPPAPPAAAGSADAGQASADAGQAEATPAAAPSLPPMALDDLVPLPPLPPPGRHVAAPSAVLGQLGRAVVGDEAGLALAAARSAMTSGDSATARALYRRLADSPLAAEALVDEVLVLAHTQRAEDGLALADTAPVEARSDALYALQARLLLRAQRYDAARGALAAISSKGPLAREAMWLDSVALARSGAVEAAAPVLRHLASGDDAWARLARAWLHRG